VLYRRTNQPEKARACDEAIEVIGLHLVGDKLEGLRKPSTGAGALGAQRPLGNEDWAALGNDGVDLQLSGLFALVAPAFAAERARTRMRPSTRELRDQTIPPPVARVVGQVATIFGVTSPPTYADPGQAVACAVTLRAQGGVLAPILAIGRPALDGQVDDLELAFLLARQLADLRNDRFALLLCPRAAELAQIIELATGAGADAGSHGSRWLETALHAAEHDQALAIAGRLRERGIDPVRAALGWLAATERAADRIGLAITGELSTCVRVLERERTSATGEVDRIVELVWASVTEDVLGVRARLERWPARPQAAERTGS
jgi:hypothetical protein